MLPGTRQRLREATVVVAALALALLMLRQSARHPGALGPIDRLTLKALAPAQDLLTAGARKLGSLRDRYLYLVGVEAGNERLRDENRKLQSELHQAGAAVNATARLERLLGLRESLAATDPARADRGGGHLAVLPGGAGDAGPRVRPGRAWACRCWPPRGWWVGSCGVAGQRADVQLAVDPRSDIDVVIPRTGGRGLLVGKGGENGYRCLIQYFARADQVKVGDTVVTTGLGGFPRDLPVGTVARVAVQPRVAVPGGRGRPRRGLRPPGRGAGGGGAAGVANLPNRPAPALPGRGLSFYRLMRPFFAVLTASCCCCCSRPGAGAAPGGAGAGVRAPGGAAPGAVAALVADRPGGAGVPVRLPVRPAGGRAATAPTRWCYTLTVLAVGLAGPAHRRRPPAAPGGGQLRRGAGRGAGRGDRAGAGQPQRRLRRPALGPARGGDHRGCWRRRCCALLARIEGKIGSSGSAAACTGARPWAAASCRSADDADRRPGHRAARDPAAQQGLRRHRAAGPAGAGDAACSTCRSCAAMRSTAAIAQSIVRTVPLAPLRGELRDRKGRPLATTRPAFNLMVAPEVDLGRGLPPPAPDAIGRAVGPAHLATPRHAGQGRGQ